MSIKRLKWNQSHYKWSEFFLGETYRKYLVDTYGVITNGKVVWNHVLEVIEIEIEIPSEILNTSGIPSEIKSKKPQKKYIKLIFIINDDKHEEQKIKTKNISVRLISDIKNIIEEKIQSKIRLTNVQIIKR